MFNKTKSIASPVKFYNELPKLEELYTGYMHKSPNLTGVTKGMKAWRRRFFVLSKEGEDNYHLAYYTDEKRGKLSGEIDLTKVSLICSSPEKHQIWDWIQKTFKCSSSSVLLLRVEDVVQKYARDYFLVGENSEEMETMHNALLQALNSLTSDNKVRVTDDNLQQDSRCRSISEPMLCQEPKDRADRQLFRQSVPICIFTNQPMSNSHYCEAHKVLDTMSAGALIDSDDDDEEDIEEKSKDIEEQHETEGDDSEYMTMESVHEVLEQNQLEGDAYFQTNTSQDLYTAADDTDSPVKQKQKSMHSPPEMNGHCTSAETNKSETLKSIEKEICISKNDFQKNLILTQKEGKPCVSECKQIEISQLFHKEDQILTFNDMEVETVGEIQMFFKKLNKDEVKLTILRHPGSEPFVH
ncbi:pleckstrin homology domain-containing family S member 1-like isoform X3 [Paramisgurnus dabryanus]|uniref:pleckstrin homology domain-containing family S member 1-like isoform X3 n=1 Tax=Paramisgurnus dabryanus TaxID=90735 RepID=UPI003CCF28EA